MVKESKNIDFYTTGRQPSQEDFERISAWIQKKEKKSKSNKPVARKRSAKRKIA